jgi:uncharacterized protein (TIGR02598 family)
VKKNSPKAHGFSLVEVVIALGIFAFSIVAIVALLPVGLRSARSVADESNAVNVGESIFGAWEMQKNKGVPLSIDEMAGDLPRLTEAVSDHEVYLDSHGKQTPDASIASMKLIYSVVPDPAQRRSTLTLRFYWPPSAPPETAQTRDLVKIFAL